MLNKKIIAIGLFLSELLLSTSSLASPCDNMPLTIIGSENYEYSIILGKGNFDRKDSGYVTIYHRTVNKLGNVHRVFSAKGTRGGVVGEVLITNLETYQTITLPFTLYKNSSCFTKLPIVSATMGKAYVHAHGMRNAGIIFTVKEFK